MEQTISKSSELAEHINHLFTEKYTNHHVYESSVMEVDGVVYALCRNGTDKQLLAASENESEIPGELKGKNEKIEDFYFKVCPLTPDNAEAIRSLLPFTKPVLIGNKNSFGFGDRLGNSGAAHLKSLEESGFIPIMAQQSIREMDRTKRSAQEVMDAATWAVLQAGYTDGVGSDADHLKTFADIDRTISVGFTMFTIDPSDYVDNRVVDMNETQLEKALMELPWDKLKDTPENFKKRYIGRKFEFDNDVTLEPSEIDILRAAVKYGNVVVHTSEMYRYLKEVYPDKDSEVELSVDETPHPTTPEEHLIVASELQRLGVELVSLAPRFCGDFEKGIDFKGDLEQFKKEYLLHQAIAGAYGEYKLSVHSGSDKFLVYEAIGELNVGTVHVKTAGTSYLEALRAVAITDKKLFREILEFSLGRFETDKKTYHISADLRKMPTPKSITDDALPGLLDDDNARQIFHVTFGSVLTKPSENSEQTMKQRMMATLAKHEVVYEDCLYRHFRKHLEPFEK